MATETFAAPDAANSLAISSALIEQPATSTDCPREDSDPPYWELWMAPPRSAKLLSPAIAGMSGVVQQPVATTTREKSSDTVLSPRREPTIQPAPGPRSNRSTGVERRRCGVRPTVSAYRCK